MNLSYKGYHALVVYDPATGYYRGTVSGDLHVGFGAKDPVAVERLFHDTIDAHLAACAPTTSHSDPLFLEFHGFDPDDPEQQAEMTKVMDAFRELYRSVGGDDLIFIVRRRVETPAATEERMT